MGDPKIYKFTRSQTDYFVVSQRDVSSWDRNPADFTSVGYLTPESLSFSGMFYIYLSTYTLSANWSAQFLR